MRRVPKLVQNMPAIRVADGYSRVLKREPRTVGHPELVHHVTGRCIRRYSDRDNLRQIGCLERNVNHSTSTFGGEALTLRMERETPPDLNHRLGHVWNRIPHHLHANGSYKHAGLAQLGGKHREAITSQLHIVTVDGFVA